MSRVTLSDQTVSMAYLSSDFQKPLTSVHTVSLQTGTGMGLLSFTKVSPPQPLRCPLRSPEAFLGLVGSCSVRGL